MKKKVKAGTSIDSTKQSRLVLTNKFRSEDMLVIEVLFASIHCISRFKSHS